MTLSEICAVGQSLSDAVVTDTYEYDAFGNSFTVSGTTPNEMMYRGEQYDSDLGLYYLRARYYNPLTGRFMSRDPNDPQLMDSDGMPIDPKYLHKYLYAGGDPINQIDPSGRAAYIESILTERVYISSSLEIAVVNYGQLVAGGICGMAKVIASAFSTWPPSAPSPIVVPVWSIKALAALCTAGGF
jgi:RHS repeat-associated protein